MNHQRIGFAMIAVCSFMELAAAGSLDILWGAPKIIGSKAIVPLEIANHLAHDVESLRIAVFLAEPSGKTFAQASRWVIGGNEPRGLAVGKTNLFNFVITGPRDLPTNVTAKVTVGRLVLDGGQLGDIERDVTVSQRSQNP